jgi:hypothetical protein
METPDKWVVIKIGNDESTLYKVFASWYGGYLGSDSWKVNSGIVKVEEDEKYIRFYGYSGSCYQCVKGTYGMNIYSQGVLNNIIESARKMHTIVTVMDENTNWLKLLE